MGWQVNWKVRDMLMCLVSSSSSIVSCLFFDWFVSSLEQPPRQHLYKAYPRQRQSRSDPIWCFLSNFIMSKFASPYSFTYIHNNNLPQSFSCHWASWKWRMNRGRFVLYHISFYCIYTVHYSEVNRTRRTCEVLTIKYTSANLAQTCLSQSLATHLIVF